MDMQESLPAATQATSDRTTGIHPLIKCSPWLLPSHSIFLSSGQRQSCEAILICCLGHLPLVPNGDMLHFLPSVTYHSIFVCKDCFLFVSFRC